MNIKSRRSGQSRAFNSLRLAGALGLALVTAAVSSAVSDFEHPASAITAQQFAPASVQRQDTPNDSAYDCAELDTTSSSRCSNLFDEHFDLFGFASQLTTGTAIYADPTDTLRFGKAQISGYNAAGAWKAERGRPDVSIAILDTGIRWEKTELRRQVRLSCGELPAPQNAAAATLAGSSPQCLDKTALYDLNGNGAFDVDDYANDARVNKNGGTFGVAGLVDAEDLITAFSNADDADGNGYIDDIAGWDFFDNDNDAYDKSSYFAAGNHGSGRTGEAIEQSGDGQGSLGICPHCQFVPLRVWDTFVSDANTFGLAITYAADNGVSVIEGADGGLYHSAFTEAAVNYAHAKGVVQTFSGDDLNTGNHNYPAAYNHVMLIEGTAPDNIGLGVGDNNFQTAREFFCVGPLATLCPGSNSPTGTYFRGANTTQFGGKSSISMEGATGSVNTGKASGAAALVVSAGRNFSPALPLSADEVRELLEQTAEDVTLPNTAGTGQPDFAQAGWDSHFGYGRVNLGAAVQAVKDGNIPPEAAINGPDWYAPLVGSTVNISGIARARRSATGNFHYKVEWAAGHMPSGNATNPWTVVKEGDASGTLTDFGSINLATVRTALTTYVVPTDLGDATFAPGVRHPLQDHFTVRITVSDPAKPNAIKGVDRKVLTAVPDGQNLVTGYPKRLGTGGEAPLRYADINGDNVQELILPLEDGTIHAYAPNGSELPGWPVQMLIFPRAANHLAAPVFASGTVAAPREPPRGPTIADLDNDGRQWVITAAGEHVYVFAADGTPRAGFPVQSDPSFCTTDKQKQENLHPKCGFLASPAVARLDGPLGKPSIVVPGLDGRLYAWHADGSPVSWSPRLMQDTSIAAADRQIAESINSPAIGDLNGDGIDDIIAATHEAYDESGGTPVPTVPGAPSDVSFASVGLKSTRVYAINGATGALLPGAWPLHIAGIIQDVLPFIGPSADPLLVKVGGAQRIVASATGTGVSGVGSGLSSYTVAGAADVLMKQDGKGGASNITDNSGGLNLFESAIAGNLTGVAGAPLSIVKYQLGVADAANLLLVGQNFPYNHMIGAWNATSGTSEAAYPTITDDFQFLSSSTIAKVVAGTSNQIVTGTGLGLLHAYDGVTARDATGFPKVTGGWLFAPAAISDDGRMAAITREGFLFQWSVGQPSCQSEWPSFRHDQQSSGNYDRDGTPPGAVRALSATPGAMVQLAWTAPGDDALCGTATRHVVKVDGNTVSTGLPAPVASGGAQTMSLAGLGSSFHRITVQAVDEAGNLGFPVPVTVGTPPVAEPAHFVLIDRVNVPVNTFITSEAVTLSGFTGLLDISVDNGGQYSIDGAAFTNVPGKIGVGSKVVVRHVSASTLGTSKISRQTVGGYATNFRSTTTEADRVPNAFDFGRRDNVAAAAMATSDAIILSGFNTAIPIVAGPDVEYRIGNGVWTRANGTLLPAEGTNNAQQTLQVRHTSNSAHLGYTKSYLKVGGVTGYFTTRTR